MNETKLKVLNSEACGSSYEPKKDEECEDCFKQAVEITFLKTDIGHPIEIQGRCWASSSLPLQGQKCWALLAIREWKRLAGLVGFSTLNTLFS